MVVSWAIPGLHIGSGVAGGRRSRPSPETSREVGPTSCGRRNLCDRQQALLLSHCVSPHRARCNLCPCNGDNGLAEESMNILSFLSSNLSDRIISGIARSCGALSLRKIDLDFGTVRMAVNLSMDVAAERPVLFYRRNVQVLRDVVAAENWQSLKA